MRPLRGAIALAAVLSAGVGIVGAPARAASGGPTGSCSSPSGSVTGLPVHAHCTITASTSNAPVTNVSLRILRPSDGAQVTAATFTPNTHSYTLDADYTISSNGHYHLLVSATEDDAGVVSHTQNSGTPVDQFFDLDVPPAPPANVKASLQDDRSTVVSWDANKEPDLQGYAIQRTDADSSTWRQIGSISSAVQPPKFTDASTGAAAGGTYRFRVFALRSSSDQNPDPAKRVLVQSNPSSEAKVTASSTVATTSAGGSGGAGGGQSGGSGSAGGSSGSAGGAGSSAGGAPAPALATAGKVDLRQFAALLDKARKSDGGASAPDPGFGATLPFKPGSTNVAEDGAGEQTLGSGSAEGQVAGVDVRTALPFVAGSLLLTVLLMHVLFVKAEVRRADALDAVPVDGEPPPFAGSSGGAVSPEDQPAPV